MTGTIVGLVFLTAPSDGECCTAGGRKQKRCRTVPLPLRDVCDQDLAPCHPSPEHLVPREMVDLLEAGETPHQVRLYVGSRPHQVKIVAVCIDLEKAEWC